MALEEQTFRLRPCSSLLNLVVGQAVKSRGLESGQDQRSIVVLAL
jgi:hypothetical protein